VSSFTSADGLKDWETIWLIPASMALVVLVLFVFTFRDDRKVAVSAPEVAGA
jgi:hypothetical protein